MTLTYHEKLFSFDLIVFDFKKRNMETVNCSDDFIKKAYTINEEGIGKLYFESLGWEVEEFGRKKKSPIGFPDLVIKKGGESRGVEVKQWGNFRGVKDTIKLPQLEYYFEHEGIILFVKYRDIERNVSIEY